MDRMRGTHAASARCGAARVVVGVALGVALLFVASACSKPPELNAQAAAEALAATPQEPTPAAATIQEPAAPTTGLQGEMAAAQEEESPETAVGSLVKADGAVAGTPDLPATTEEVVEPALEGAGLPRLIDLGANKCIPCKRMAPILEELAKTHKAFFEVEVIDVWVNPDRGKEYNVRIIPTQIFYDAEGKELYRHIGFYSKEDILNKWRELGVDVGT